MPLLIPDPINEILTSSGLLPQENPNATRVQRILDESGLSLHEAIQALNVIAKTADKEETRLGALRDVLKMQGALNEEQARVIPQISFIIHSDKVQINNVLCPLRVADSEVLSPTLEQPKEEVNGRHF